MPLGRALSEYRDVRPRAQGVEGGQIALVAGEIEAAGEDAGVLGEYVAGLAAEGFGLIAHLDQPLALVAPLPVTGPLVRTCLVRGTA